MLLNEKEKFEEMLISLFDAYSRTLSEGVFNTWFSVFEKYPLGEISVAMQSYIENDRFPPVPAGVLERMPSKPHKITAAEAWTHVPKLESESGFVTRSMMQALGTAEESILRNDYVGAKIAFVETFNSLPPDNNFYYSQAYGVDFEETRQRKINDLKLIASKGWLPPDQKEKIAASLQLKAAPPRKELQHDAPEPTEEQKKRNRSRIKNLVNSLKLKDEDGEPA